MTCKLQSNQITHSYWSGDDNVRDDGPSSDCWRHCYSFLLVLVRRTYLTGKASIMYETLMAVGAGVLTFTVMVTFFEWLRR
jgi:hypothetical protein